jgi:hypothetical protein
VKIGEKIRGDDAMSFAVKAFFVLLFTSAVLFMPVQGNTSDITTINFRQADRDLIVNAFLQFDQKIIEDINEGLPKEIIFSVDLMKSRKLWPNDIVKSVVIVKSLQSNPIKREYIGTLIQGREKKVRRFKDVSSLITWGCSIEELKLPDIDIEENGEYFIRVSAESRMLALPAVVDYLLFFLPTKEFNVSKDTYLFKLSPQAAK